jgi:hypothetical protein
MPKAYIIQRKLVLPGGIKIIVDLYDEQSPAPIQKVKFDELVVLRREVIHVCSKNGKTTALERREAVRLYHALMDLDREIPDDEAGDLMRDAHGLVLGMLLMNFPKVRKSQHPNPRCYVEPP